MRPLHCVPKTRWVGLAEYGKEGISISSKGEITDQLSSLSWKPFVNPVTMTSGGSGTDTGLVSAAHTC